MSAAGERSVQNLDGVEMKCKICKKDGYLDRDEDYWGCLNCFVEIGIRKKVIKDFPYKNYKTKEVEKEEQSNEPRPNPRTFNEMD